MEPILYIPETNVRIRTLSMKAEKNWRNLKRAEYDNIDDIYINFDTDTYADTYSTAPGKNIVYNKCAYSKIFVFCPVWYDYNIQNKSEPIALHLSSPVTDGLP